VYACMWYHYAKVYHFVSYGILLVPNTWLHVYQCSHEQPHKDLDVNKRGISSCCIGTTRQHDGSLSCLETSISLVAQLLPLFVLH